MTAGRAAVVVAGLAATTACTSREKHIERAPRRLDLADVWPEAPRPTVTTGTRRLAYNPRNVTGYVLSADASTEPGAAIVLTATMSITFGFRAATTPTAREALLAAFALKVDAPGQHLDFRFDGTELYFKQGFDEPTIIKPGDRDAAIDVTTLATRPLGHIQFTDAGTVEFSANTDHPLHEVGSESINRALILFPDLPVTEIPVGHTWHVRRTVELANNLGKVDVDYAFVYAGDGACPSGAGTCAHLTFTASSDNLETTTRGHAASATYSFAGKVFLDLERGVISESRVRMDVDARIAGQDMPLGGTIRVKPT